MLQILPRARLPEGAPDSRKLLRLTVRHCFQGEFLHLPGAEHSPGSRRSQGNTKDQQSNFPSQPHFDGDGRLARLVARIRVQGELSELRGAVDPFDAGQMDELERLFSAELERQAQAALDRSQSTGVDFLHLRREMVFQCPLHTGELSEHWEEWFPALELEAVVEGRIVRSYDVNRTAEGEDTL